MVKIDYESDNNTYNKNLFDIDDQINDEELEDYFNCENKKINVVNNMIEEANQEIYNLNQNLYYETNIYNRNKFKFNINKLKNQISKIISTGIWKLK